MKLAWISSWDRACGIATYSRTLWPAVRDRLEGELVSLDEFGTPRALLGRLIELEPSVVHFQHEYGLFGGKNPPRYFFPKLVRELRQHLPSARIVATAHTVLAEDYEFPVKGRGIEIPARALANKILLPILRRTWGTETWGGLDGVIVHSRLQKPIVERAGAKRVKVIPHFVPVVPVARALPGKSSGRKILVFGFFTPEKGQDIAIEALARLPAEYSLVLAGGVRRGADESYLRLCQEKIERLGLASRVEITGFVEDAAVDGFYANADLVLAPFRETTGSGSLAQGFARGAAILASDHPLNREIAEREAGALAFFRSEDPADCAAQIRSLCENSGALDSLRLAGLRYASSCSIEKTVEAHLAYYSLMVGSTYEDL